MDTTSLLDLTRSLATDDAAKASFRADPEGFLHERGHGDLDPADLSVALRHAADALPPAIAVPVTDVAASGSGIVDQLLGIVDIDPVEADAAWAEVTGAPSLDDLPDDELGGLDPFDDDRLLVEPDALDEDALDGDALDGRVSADEKVRGGDPDDVIDDDADDRGGFGRGDRAVAEPSFAGGELDDGPGGFDPADLDERPGGLDAIDDAEAAFSSADGVSDEGFDLAKLLPDDDGGEPDPSGFDGP